MRALRYAVFPVVIGLVSCTAYQQQGSLIGGVAGGLMGAAFGDDHQDVIAGAAVGAGLGAGVAALHEDSLRRRSYTHNGIQDPRYPQGQGRQMAPLPPQSPGSPPRTQPLTQPKKDYPTAQLTTTPGQVLSPYPPHGRIDVSGFESGQLAKDPSTGEIFRIP